MTPFDQTTASAPRTAGHIISNLRAWIAAVLGPPKSRPAMSPFRLYGWYLVAGCVAIVLSMFFFDQAAIRAVARVPVWVNRAFNDFTDFGLSGWFLVPLGSLILLLAIVDAPSVARWSRLAMAALVARLGFLFVAIALPGIVQAIVKHQIGRQRPSDLGPFAFEPFSWQHQFTSLPSGHATTAFGAAVAFGALFPRLRPLLWTYAILIAVSRVVISTHYPSDVIAGAFVGSFGALLVRNWFAERRLGFYVGSDQRVYSLPGPSLERLKRVAWGPSAP
jgi:membrane-associated phospholipid phosphatase